MMSLATLIIGQENWIIPAACLMAVLCLAVWLSYRSISVNQKPFLSAGLLKACAFGLLTFFLIEPLWSGTHVKPGANLFAILVDESRSLAISDSDTKRPRSEQLKQIVGNRKTPWQLRLEQDFNVRRFTVGSRLQTTDDFNKTKFDGASSMLVASLKTFQRRTNGLPVAGALLFTDWDALPANSENLPPIYPVVIGNSENLKDLAIGRVTLSETNFEDAPVTIQAKVHALGVQSKDVKIELLNNQGEVIHEEYQTPKTNDESLSFRIQFRPITTGIAFYKLRVSTNSLQTDFDNPELSQEATLANNIRTICINRKEIKQRILYVSGRPNWEFKFLNRAIEGDPQIQLVGLIRIAKREARFDFRGRSGESSNPLFRGFDKQAVEETEQYDEAVLIRLNTRNADELSAGFPKTAKELFGYDAVILDDLESEFFTHDQMALLQRFVSERGGGLLMLGGQESLQKGNFRHTPLDEILPVYLTPSTATPGKQYRLSLTRDGWIQPWARLCKTEQEEQTRLAEMPSFKTVNRLTQIKPGARVIAQVSDQDGALLPALITQQFGRGKSAALTIGDFWRWQLKRPEPKTKNNSDLYKSWRQTLRWLVADVPNRFEIAINSKLDSGQTVFKIQVKARDEQFLPAATSNVKIVVKTPEGEELTLAAEPSLVEAGLFETEFAPRSAGAYHFLATIFDEEGLEIGKATTGTAVDPAFQEFRSVKPNRQQLEHLAKITGGEVLTADDLNEFVKTLSTADVPVTEQRTYPLWHQSWISLLVTACLVGEWGLRRWKGLP